MLTYTEIAILVLGYTALYMVLKSLGLKWQIEHMQASRARRRRRR